MEKRDFLMPLREFSSVKVGDKLPEKTYPLTRQDLVNYAGVSGDLNPIHWDDEIRLIIVRSPVRVRPSLQQNTVTFLESRENGHGFQYRRAAEDHLGV